MTADESTPLLPPLVSTDRAASSGELRSFANMFITVIGAGVLGLPYAFHKTGWLSGLIILATVASISAYCMMLLVWTRHALILRRCATAAGIRSFGDLGNEIFGEIGKNLVDCLIVLAQMSFCVGYLIFISDTLSPLFGAGRVLAAAVPVQLALNAIPTLTHLAPLSLAADVVSVVALAAVVMQDAKNAATAPVVTAVGDPSAIPYGVGVALYCFEGVAMVIPLHSEFREHAPGKFARVVGTCMVVIAVCYGVFGVAGYWAFGEGVKHIVTLNFEEGFWRLAVNCALSAAMMITFPLMMNPVHDATERRLSAGGGYSMWVRSANVILATLTAVLVPNFADFVSLVGSSICVVLGFVLPAVFHLAVCWRGCSAAGIAMDFGIVSFGLVFAVTGTVSAVVSFSQPAA